MPAPVILPPSFRSTATATATTTCNKPANTGEGDLMVALILAATQPSAGPTGWTNRVTGNNGAASAFIDIWTKVAGASEPANYTWTNAGYTDIVIISYQVGDKASPYDTGLGNNAGNTSTPSTSSITTAINNEMLVMGYSPTAGGAWTMNSGQTERADFDGVCAAEKLQATAGSTGTLQVTNGGGAAATAAAIVAIRPAPNFPGRETASTIPHPPHRTR